MNNDWPFEDAWVLASIGGDSRDTGVTLTRIIGNAHRLNHAILLEYEFSHAMGHLLAAGLARVDLAGDRYWLTDRGAAVRDSRKRKDESLGPVRSGLRKLGPPPPADTGWTLPLHVFERARDAYLDTSYPRRK